MRTFAALVLALALVPPMCAASRVRHAPVRRTTAGFVETVALRIPAGSTPGNVSDALPCLGARSLGGAFVGRDGRLYVWDDGWANVKIVSFGPDGRTRTSVTPYWPNWGDSIRIVGGDADTSGRVFLLSAPIGDRILCRVFTCEPGDRDWDEWELPRYGGYAETGGLGLHDGIRLRVLADGRAVLVPANAAPAARGLLVWQPGPAHSSQFVSIVSAQVADTPELAAPRTDLAGHRVLPDGGAGLVIADSAGRALASMASPAWPQWKRVRVEGRLYEPQGTVLALQTTSRGLVIRRLVPEISGVPIVPAAADTLPARRVKPRRPPHRHASSSLTG